VDASETVMGLFVETRMVIYIHGLWFPVESSEFKVQGSKFKVQGDSQLPTLNLEL